MTSLHKSAEAQANMGRFRDCQYHLTPLIKVGG